MAEWWAIEVFHNEFRAAPHWRYPYSSLLTESAISHGAVEPGNERVLDLTAVAAPGPFRDLCATM